jgi:O-antigen ligase
MQPYIALTLCIAFIALLFILDSKRKNRVSFAIWLPTIWMMYCGSRPLAYWFSETPSNVLIDAAEGSAVDRAFISVLIVIGILILSRRVTYCSRILKNNPWIFIFFAYMALSMLWSDIPAISLKRLIKTTADLIMVLLLLSEVDVLEAIKTTFRRSAFVLLPLSILFIKYYGDIGLQYSEDGSVSMWVGVTTQKNVLGYVVMVYGVYFVSNIVAAWKSRKISVDLLFLMMVLWLFRGSSSSYGSATSAATFALGIGILLLTYWTAGNPKKLRNYIIIVVSLLIFSNMAYVTFFGSPFEAAAGAMGRDVTLTGRTEIWNIVLDIGPGNTLLGRGYGSFWIGNFANQVWDRLTYHIQIVQSHNGYIDIYLELGVIGLILLAGVIWSAYNKIGRTLETNIEYTAFRLAFITMLLMHNLVESSFARPAHLLWFLFLLACMCITGQPGLRERTL